MTWPSRRTYLLVDTPTLAVCGATGGRGQGTKEHTRYLVEEQADGTLIWRPAVVVPEHELRFMTAYPDEYARIREGQASPDPGRLRDRPARTRRPRSDRPASAEPVAALR
jgi:hypothetical protein